MIFQLIVTIVLFIGGINALSAAEWRTQSIYFLLTDRFGRTDNSTTATCDTGDQVSKMSSMRRQVLTIQIYCGGSWQGVINHVSLKPQESVQSYSFEA